MKLKLVTKLIEKILKMNIPEEGPRADMYLPVFLLAFGLALILGGIGAAVAFIFLHKVWIIVMAVAAVLLGIAAIMCWRNQTVNMISDDVFVYTTMFGNHYEYRFEDITAIRQNSDSITLFVGNKKVHIEAMAVMSERLVARINLELSKKYQSK